MQGKQLQDLLFARILKKYNNNDKTFTKDISKILHLTSNVVYDRINGKKLLNIEEIFLLSKHYNIGLDDLVTSNVVSFEVPVLKDQPATFDDYMNTILKDLRKLATLKSCEIIYVASETPFFYYLADPLLALFKMYIWGRTIWQIPSLENQKFNVDELSNENTIALIDELLELYVRFPTTEIWNVNILDTTINQISHCLYCGFFENPEDALLLINAMSEMVDRMEKIVKKGRKSTTGTSKIYYNELVQNPTLILVNSPVVKSVYLVYDSPNLMINHSEDLFNHTYNYYEKAAQASLHLSEERHRARFFKTIRAKLSLAKEAFLVATTL